MKKVTAVNKEYFEKYGEGKGYENSYKDFGFYLEMITSEIESAGIAVNSILDVGCAQGLTVRDLRNAGFDAYGIEVYAPILLKAPASVKPYVKVKRLEEISTFKKDAFDLGFVNSLMYVEEKDILKFLKDARKVFRSGMFIINPTSDHPWTIPTDPDRKTLKTSKWWDDTLLNYGWTRPDGCDYLYIKI